MFRLVSEACKGAGGPFSIVPNFVWEFAREEYCFSVVALNDFFVDSVPNLVGQMQEASAARLRRYYFLRRTGLIHCDALRGFLKIMCKSLEGRESDLVSGLSLGLLVSVKCSFEAAFRQPQDSAAQRTNQCGPLPERFNIFLQ